MSILSFGANEYRLLTSAKVPRPGVRLLELDAGILGDIYEGRCWPISAACNYLTALLTRGFMTGTASLSRVSQTQKPYFAQPGVPMP